MRKQRISEDDAQALLSGRAPRGRDDLQPLADALAEIREAAFEDVAQPSTALASRLDLAAASRISPALAATPDRHVVGTAARIALGVGVAVGATLFATAGAGAAGVLPGPAQEAFDTVVSTVLPGLGYGPTVIEGTPSPEPFTTEDPAHPENFGGEVSERAKDPNKNGHEFGQETSEDAKDNGNGPPADNNGNGPPADNNGNGNGDPGVPGTPENPGSQGNNENVPPADNNGNGQPGVPGQPDETGKPDGTPGGNPNK